MFLRMRILLVVILLSLMILPALAQDTIPSLNQVYVDDRDGFTMPYPGGWLVQQQVVGQTLYVVATPGHLFDMAAGPPSPGKPVAIMDFGSLTELTGLPQTMMAEDTKPIRAIQNYLGPEVPFDLPTNEFQGKLFATYTNQNKQAGFELIGIAVMLDDDYYVMATLYKAIGSDDDFVDVIMTMMANATPGGEPPPPPTATPTPEPEDSTSGRFITPDLKYSFTYPKVWDPEITYDRENGIASLKATIYGAPFLMNSMVIAEPDMPPAEYLEPGGPWLHNNKVELIESEEFDVAGLMGAMITYTTEDTGPVPITVYALDLNNGYFVLSLTRGGPMDDALFRVTVKIVLQSFVVTGATPKTAAVVLTAEPTEAVVDKDAARESFNEGLALSNERDYAGAIIPYTQTIAIDPEYKSAYYRRGEAYFVLEEYDKALEDLNQAIAIDPEYHEAYNQRGRVYEELKNFEAAVADYSQAIAWYRGRGNPIEYLNNRGITYRSLGDFENALVDFNKAIELNPNTTYTYVNRGITYRMMGENLEQALMDLRFYNASLNTPNGRIAEIIAELEEQLGLDPGEPLLAETAATIAKPLLGVDRDAPVGEDATVIDVSDIGLLGRWDSPNDDAALMVPRDWVIGKTGNIFTAASSEELLKYEPFSSLQPGQFWMTIRSVPAILVANTSNPDGTLGEVLQEIINNGSDEEFIPAADAVTEVTEVVIDDKPYGMARFSGAGYEGAMLYAHWRINETMRGLKGLVMVTAPGEFAAVEETFYAVAASYGLPEDVRIDPETVPTFTLDDVEPLTGQTWQVLKNFKDEPVPYPIEYAYPEGWVAETLIGEKFAPNEAILALDYFENALEEGQIIVTVNQVAARIAIYPGESPVQYMVRRGRFDTVSNVQVNGEETARGRTIMENGNLRIELMRQTHDSVLVVVTGYMHVDEETRWDDLLYGMLMSVKPISP